MVKKCASSNIVESSGGVETPRIVSAYHEPAWHFNAKFVNGQGHVMANGQKATDHVEKLGVPMSL